VILKFGDECHGVLLSHLPSFGFREVLVQELGEPRVLVLQLVQFLKHGGLPLKNAPDGSMFGLTATLVSFGKTVLIHLNKLDELLQFDRIL